MALLRSFEPSANVAGTEFPLNNLPCGVFATGGDRRCGVAIGDMILDCRAAEAAGLTGTDGLLAAPSWNALMAAGPARWGALRERLTALLAEGATQSAAPLVPQADATLHLPFEVAEFTDFYSSRQHAFNVGSMFRGPADALPPNWDHLPIGYNGRASTVVVSGTDVRRPLGQTRHADAPGPTFGPSRRLDFELELGAVVGTPSAIGEPLSVAAAREMIFGYVLLNDWSARDIQAWEYQPLGPFQAKAFATTISPWIVTRAALAPFAIATPPWETELLAYLREDHPGLFDIALTAEVQAAGGTPTVVSRTNYGELSYSAAQQLAHHASSGCAMRTGDLLGSGTISGPAPENFGSLLEITWGGKRPLTLADGGTRTFLEDGDAVTLRGHAAGPDYRIGFGICAGRILPALPPDHARGGRPS